MVPPYAPAVTTVTIPAAVLRRGELPPVCVRTGAPADGTVVTGFRNRLGWAWLLLVLGVVPFLVALALLWRSARGPIPLSAAAHRAIEARVRRSRRLGLAGLLLLTVGTLAVGAVAPEAVAGAVAGLVAAIGLGLLVAAWWSDDGVAGYVDRSGAVVLTEVDDAFAAAVAGRVPA